MSTTSRASSESRELIESHAWRLQFLRLRAFGHLAIIEAMGASLTDLRQYQLAIQADIELDLCLRGAADRLSMAGGHPDNGD